MLYTEWEPLYFKILADFSFSKEQDIQSATLLNTLLSTHPHYKSLSTIGSRLHHNPVIIIGAASTVSDQIISHKHLISSCITICADGATSALLKHQIIPTIIVTDLDGNIPDQITANTKGSILIVHAHGDNKEGIKTIVPTIQGPISGTTQTNPEPFSHVDNVGGFTDGDRAVFLAENFQATPIYLLGFDFQGPFGEYSNLTHKNLTVKRKKLHWAEQLINQLNRQGNIHYLK